MQHVLSPQFYDFSKLQLLTCNIYFLLGKWCVNLSNRQNIFKVINKNNNNCRTK